MSLWFPDISNWKLKQQVQAGPSCLTKVTGTEIVLMPLSWQVVSLQKLCVHLNVTFSCFASPSYLCVL